MGALVCCFRFLPEFADFFRFLPEFAEVFAIKKAGRFGDVDGKQ